MATRTARENLRVREGPTPVLAGKILMEPRNKERQPTASEHVGNVLFLAGEAGRPGDVARLVGKAARTGRAGGKALAELAARADLLCPKVRESVRVYAVTAAESERVGKPLIAAYYWGRAQEILDTPRKQGGVLEYVAALSALHAQLASLTEEKSAAAAKKQSRKQR